MKYEKMTTDTIIELVKGYAKDKAYLEIGVYRGVLLSEVAKVAKTAIGIDDFSQFDTEGTNKQTTLERIGDTAKLIDGDCYSGTVTKRIKHVDVLFYDAGHTYQQTSKALELYTKKMKKGGVIIIDDWNVPHIQQATSDIIGGISKLVEEHFTEKNGSDDYWNGIGVFRLL
jgi:predicted O-methyltransferase YrrM